MPSDHRHVPALITPVELPLWVPGTITCSSDDLGWKDVAQRSYSYRGQDVEIPPLDSFMIVRYRHGVTPMDRQFDGRWTRTSCEPGHFSLLSRSAESHWHWTAPVEVSHLYLSNALMSRVASDMLGKEVDQVQLHDVLRGSDKVVNRIVDDITCEAAQQTSGGAIYAEALGVQLAVHLLRHYASCICPESVREGCLSRSQCALLHEYIDSHLQEKITLQELAALFDMGVWTFGRYVQKSLGCTVQSLLMLRRIERAKELLGGDSALKQIAATCGFSDQSHMTRSFRKHLGVTPLVYRLSI
ncbi:MAG: helix-turn-helix transcriptional regulator [Granulosicoccus sp.]